MYIKFDKKFTDLNLDEFVERMSLNISRNPGDTYQFDFTETEYVSNQELLVFTAYLNLLFEARIGFEVILFKKGESLKNQPARVKYFIIQIWDVWKIWSSIDDIDYIRYFGIDGNSVDRLKREMNYFPKASEIYTRYGITPFIPLDHILNYDANDVQLIIDPIYNLNEALVEILAEDGCYHPFVSNLLSSIITEELYLNFLDHSQRSSYKNFNNKAFMSIAFQRKLDEKDKERVQAIKAQNFKTEAIPESLDFFYDSKKKKFKNFPYLQFSFLDFGEGIINSLQSYAEEAGIKNKSEILALSFNHSSSRHPIDTRVSEETFIPRGLFDILILVKRYKGLLVVRSNTGKILYDFSNNKDITAYKTFFKNQHYSFPGTLLTIYIPALTDETTFNYSSIKPEYGFDKIKPDKINLVNFSEILSTVSDQKKNGYTDLLRGLRERLFSKDSANLSILNFEGLNAIPKNILKKTIYFLISDYNINHSNNVIILNLSNAKIVDEIQYHLQNLNSAIKNFKIHPLPIININPNGSDMTINWLGIYDDSDKKKLDNLLFEDFSLANSDFNDPQNIIGHLNEFDSFGNLMSNLPSQQFIVKYLEDKREQLNSKEVNRLITEFNCVIEKNENTIFLCSGNYYQYEYIELTNLLNDNKSCNILTNLLFDSLKRKVVNCDRYKFLGIGAPSQKILKSLEFQGLVAKEQYTALDGYNVIEEETFAEKIDSNFEYILICDVIATGFLTEKLNNQLQILGAKISYVAVLVNSKYSNKDFPNTDASTIISLFKLPIERFTKSSLKEKLKNLKIVRINPHTNIPITLSIEETGYSDSIIFSSKISFNSTDNTISITNRFLDNLKNDYIKIGFLKFNNLIHPYFFDTYKLLSGISIDFLKETFTKINHPSLNTEKIQLFYPRKSGIQFLNFDLLKEALSNYSIQDIEIERFSTKEGWKFPHNSNYLRKKVLNDVCLILDDGSCSGDSIFQMIDEISFYKTKEIVLVSFIGRVNDHKREFFSRISNLKVKDGLRIPISIFFVSHWHIPTYYVDENPNSEEIHWLNEITTLLNAPYPIKNIASNVLKSITPKPEETFVDYKYLPVNKGDNALTVPKKEMILVREEVGKVIGYRLYKESFTFFDFFFKKYENRVNSIDRYKEIELLCATFIFEPYLFDRISKLLPDITEQIENFVEILLFSNDKIFELLTYNWKKKDIIHLFFIVFRDEKLLKHLTSDNFKKLINFTLPIESSLNYVLYKLLFYFPLKVHDLQLKKYDTQIRDLIKALKDDTTLPTREMRRFYNFITTLPTRDDYYSQVLFLQENYRKQDDSLNHIEKNSFGHSISASITSIQVAKAQIENQDAIDSDRIRLLKGAWYKIVDFLNPILTFSATFKGFLSPYPYFTQLNKHEVGFNSLRAMVGQNEDIINSLDESYKDVEKLDLVKRNISVIQTDFDKNSNFYNLITEAKTNLNDFLNNMIGQIGKITMNEGKEKALVPLVINEFEIDEKIVLNIPKGYLELLVQKELVTNLLNHSKRDTTSTIKIDIKLQNNEVQFRMINEIAKEEFKKSNGEGIKCLKLLEEFIPFGFSFKSEKSGSEFIQLLKFKYTINEN